MIRLPALAPLLLPWLMLLGSCSSPPKPPTVDESRRRPVNTVMAVDLQVCKTDLRNERLLIDELERAAALRQQSVKQQHDDEARPASPAVANTVFTVRFAFGSTRVSIPEELGAALVEEARSAPLIVLKGRTDGVSDALVEIRFARERAAAVRDYLVGAGIDAGRIRATYQPTGDHEADNSTSVGRSLNRRVEIEVYRAAPVAVGTAAISSAPPRSTPH